MRRILALLALLLASSGAYAQTTTTITALPAVTAPAGTDVLAEDQSGCGSGAGTCKISLSQFLTYVDTNAVLTSAQTANTSGNAGTATALAATGTQCSGAGSVATGVTASGNANCHTLASADIPNNAANTSGSAGSLSAALALTGLATQSTNTILGNYSGSTATPSALNPLAVANMLSAMLIVDYVSTSNITLSGTQTIDGEAAAVGQFVLVAGQTTSSQDGIYVVASGAWTRAVNFPSLYVILANCTISVFVQSGQVKQGHTYSLNTSGGAITIGTTAQTWTDSVLGLAGPAQVGLVYASSTPSAALPAALAVISSITAINDCASFETLAGSISDIGGGFPCTYADANFNIAASVNGLGAPAVTGSGCSLGTGTNTNNSGRIVATGADTCTLTFNTGFSKAAPNCSVGPESATVAPFISTPPTETAVIFKTGAAGTFEYVCM